MPLGMIEYILAGLENSNLRIDLIGQTSFRLDSYPGRFWRIPNCRIAEPSRVRWESD